MNQYLIILKQNWRIIFITSLISVLSSAAMVFAGFSLSFFFTAYEQKTNRINILIWTFALELVIWLGAMGIYYISLLVKCSAKKRIKHNLRNMVGTKISLLNYQQLQEKDCGNLVSWLTNDVDQIYEQSFEALFSGIEALATWIFSLGALFLLGTCIGVSALLLLAVISILPQLAEKLLKKANAEHSNAMEIAIEHYKDTVMGSNIFLLSNLQKQLAKRITNASQQAEESDYHFHCINTSVQILISTSSMIGQIILLFVSFYAAVLGSAVPGAVLAASNLSGAFFNGVGDFTQSFSKIKTSSTLWDKFSCSDCSLKDKQSIKILSDIHFENVSFSYKNCPVLVGIDYHFSSCGKYAIVGESGSGKSTLAKLLLGLLPDYSGNVHYNDLEQRQTYLASLYDQIAYVDQNVYLFQDTLRFNITLGENYSDEEINSILAQCRLTEFVGSLPEGLDTVIFENGKNLSGGQRQRIAIARSLIRNVNWIILDEGTSALDENNASEIENSLITHKDLGVILITHHLRESLKSKLTDVYKIIKQ